MKRLVPFLPLLGLVPLLHFLVFYLAGLGIVEDALALWAICFFGLTVTIGFVFGFAVRSDSGLVRYGACLGAIVAQFALIGVCPGGPQAEVLGIAHRLKRELPIPQIRSCADQLLEKYSNRTLISAEKELGQTEIWSDSVFVVDKTELPASLQSRFRWVQIRKNTTYFAEDLQVFFSINSERSIICDTRSFVSTPDLHSIQKGIHAYHHGRD
jgi:hypothetical protein